MAKLNLKKFKIGVDNIWKMCYLIGVKTRHNINVGGNMRELKIGDVVMIRADLDRGMDIPFSVNSEMELYRGKLATITSVGESWQYDGLMVYTIDLDNWAWHWNEYMFSHYRDGNRLVANKGMDDWRNL